MTESDMVACADPRRLYDFLAGLPHAVSTRRWLLFGLAAVRSLPGPLTVDVGVAADMLEEVADLPNPNAVLPIAYITHGMSVPREAELFRAMGSFYHKDHVYCLRLLTTFGLDDRVACHLLRDVFGDPPRCRPPAWQAPDTARQLALDVRCRQDWRLLPVLADALEDGQPVSWAQEEVTLIRSLDACWCDGGRGLTECADCLAAHARLDVVRYGIGLVTHLRSSVPHVCGCWAMDDILNGSANV